jgi:hypothetical protein
MSHDETNDKPRGFRVDFEKFAEPMRRLPAQEIKGTSRALQREVMRALRNPNPEKRGIIGTRQEQAARLLAQRGYITMDPLDGGLHRVTLTDAARQKSWRPPIWRRYPRLQAREEG